MRARQLASDNGSNRWIGGALCARLTRESSRPLPSAGGWPMAEDGPAQPLPRRAPSSNRQVAGGKQRPGARPVRPAALSEDALQRIRDALDSVRGEASPQEHAPRAEPRQEHTSRAEPRQEHAPRAEPRQEQASRAESPQEHAPRAERPASLPRRMPGTGKGPQPPAVIARPRLPSVRPSLPRSPADEAPTVELPALSISSYAAGNTEEITAQPEPDTARPADPPPAPAPRPPVQLQPNQQARTDGAAGLTEQPPVRQENEQGRREEESARRIKMPTARTKAASRRAKALAIASRPGRRTRPSRPPQRARRETLVSPVEPTPQMALLFPEDPAPEEATAPRSAPIWPKWARSGRHVAWLILALILVAAVAVLLAR
jgi:hypothetical protein